MEKFQKLSMSGHCCVKGQQYELGLLRKERNKSVKGFVECLNLILRQFRAIEVIKEDWRGGILSDYSLVKGNVNTSC